MTKAFEIGDVVQIIKPEKGGAWNAALDPYIGKVTTIKNRRYYRGGFMYELEGINAAGGIPWTLLPECLKKPSPKDDADRYDFFAYNIER